jgi:hypothetical protein
MFNKKTFLMSFLLEKFCSFLPPDSLNYSTSRLQSRLEKYYDKSIVIQTQQGQGQSNIVFSSSVSIGDAIKVANRLNCDLKFAQLQTQLMQVIIRCTVQNITSSPCSYWL